VAYERKCFGAPNIRLIEGNGMVSQVSVHHDLDTGAPSLRVFIIEELMSRALNEATVRIIAVTPVKLDVPEQMRVRTRRSLTKEIFLGGHDERAPSAPRQIVIIGCATV